MAKSDITLDIGSKFNGEGFKKLNQSVKGAATQTRNATKNINGVIQALGGVEGQVGKIFNNISGLMGSFAQGGIFGLAVAGIGTAFKFVMDKIEEAKRKAEEAAKAMKESFQRMFDGLGDKISRIRIGGEGRIEQGNYNTSRIEKDITREQKAQIAKIRSEGIDRRSEMTSEEEKALDLAKEELKIQQLITKNIKEQSDLKVKNATNTYNAKVSSHEASVKQVNEAIETYLSKVEEIDKKIDEQQKKLADAEKRNASTDRFQTFTSTAGGTITVDTGVDTKPIEAEIKKLTAQKEELYDIKQKAVEKIDLAKSEKEVQRALDAVIDANKDRAVAAEESALAEKRAAAKIKEATNKIDGIDNDVIKKLSEQLQEATKKQAENAEKQEEYRNKNKPKIEVEEPKPVTITPDIKVQEPKSTTIVPDIKIQEPKPTTIVPDVKVKEPKSTTIVPDIKIQEPKPTTIEPEVKVKEPKAQTIVPDIKVQEPKALMVEPNIKVQEPTAQTVEPQINIKQPKAQTITPDIKVQEPKNIVVEPNIKVKQPEVQTIVPDVIVEKPKTQTVVPDIKVKEPKTVAVEPNIKVEEPKTMTIHPKVKVESSEVETSISKKISEAKHKLEELQAAQSKAFDEFKTATEKAIKTINDPKATKADKKKAEKEVSDASKKLKDYDKPINDAKKKVEDQQRKSLLQEQADITKEGNRRQKDLNDKLTQARNALQDWIDNLTSGAGKNFGDWNQQQNQNEKGKVPVMGANGQPIMGANGQPIMIDKKQENAVKSNKQILDRITNRYDKDGDGQISDKEMEKMDDRTKKEYRRRKSFDDQFNPKKAGERQNAVQDIQDQMLQAQIDTNTNLQKIKDKLDNLGL